MRIWGIKRVVLTIIILLKRRLSFLLSSKGRWNNRLRGRKNSRSNRNRRKSNSKCNNNNKSSRNKDSKKKNNRGNSNSNNNYRNRNSKRRKRGEDNNNSNSRKRKRRRREKERRRMKGRFKRLLNWEISRRGKNRSLWSLRRVINLQAIIIYNNNRMMIMIIIMINSFLALLEISSLVRVVRSRPMVVGSLRGKIKIVVKKIYI